MKIHLISHKALFKAFSQINKNSHLNKITLKDSLSLTKNATEISHSYDPQ